MSNPDEPQEPEPLAVRASAPQPAQLIVVGTPIGNLGDWSPRAQQVLGSVALIACEDTRRTGLLLSKHGIANPGMVVMNEHSEVRATDRILDTLGAGGSVAIVSDAGMPVISDPGAIAVGAAAAAGHEVVVVPGPTAVSAALALSGFALQRWVFEGFLPRKGSDRARRLAELAGERRAIVLYEAPHRIERTLTDLTEALEPQSPGSAGRNCIVARELTKLHESVWRGSLAESAAALGEPRGEYVIVIDAADPAAPPSDDELQRAVVDAIESGATTRDAVAEVAARFGVAKRRVYALATQR